MSDKTRCSILKKRESYREAFDNFDPRKIIHYDDAKIAELMGNAGIVRNRLNITHRDCIESRYSPRIYGQTDG